MRLDLVLWIVLLALAAFIVKKLGIFGSKTGAAFAGVAEGTRNIFSPSGISPLKNPVSEFFGGLFKSPAEKEVDRIYGTRPKNTMLPGITSTEIYRNPYETQYAVNPPPPVSFKIPAPTACDYSGTCGSYPKARAPVSVSTASRVTNPPPAVQVSKPCLFCWPPK